MPNLLWPITKAWSRTACRWINTEPFDVARFDVYRNSGDKSSDVPYLLDVQSDVLEGLDSRVVVLLRRRDRYQDISLPANLIPTVEVEGIGYVLETPKLATVPLRILKTRVASLEEKRFEIGAEQRTASIAIDALHLCSVHPTGLNKVINRA